MSRLFHTAATLLLAAAATVAQAQSLDPAQILNPVPGTWPTYSGDYTSQRYSPLTQIDRRNVGKLKLAFTAKVSVSPEDAMIAGVAKDISKASMATGIRGAVLMVDGVLFVSSTDHVWALDARNGKTLWHFFWRSRGGLHIGSRGVGMWKNSIFVETPDNYLVSLDAKTGKENWHSEIASLDQQYFSTAAPIVIGDHVLAGTGNDLDMPGFLQSFDPETGKLQWRTYMVPMNPGDPGLETWKDLDAARHGGGNAWVTGSYDPETRLYIIGTGNPSPAYFPVARGDKEALYTCSLVAIDIDTGKRRWHYQTSPNESHDWDSAQTPILADVKFGGRMRKVVMTAARNGYFFVVDRVTGEHLLTSKFSDTANWAYSQLNAKGQPVRVPEKDHSIGGALVSNPNSGGANWQPAAFNPKLGLFYLQVVEAWAMYYTAEINPRGGTGLGGKEETLIGGDQFLKAIDPKTGKTAWKVRYPSASMTRMSGANGLLATASGLLFGEDARGNFIARDARNGKPLWHYRAKGPISNAPHTYMIDGKQYVVIASGTELLFFALE